MAKPSDAGGVYSTLDADADRLSGGTLGFTMLAAAQPLVVLGEAQRAGYEYRHSVIRRFQARALELFVASLRGEADPWVARLILGDAPASLGPEYHRSLVPAHFGLPMFFRTDEPALGVIGEMQCPGSGWALYEQLWKLAPSGPGLMRQLAQGFRAAAPGGEPVIHYLTDNASQPAGTRYVTQATRELGIRYFGWDRGVHWKDCNLVRSHDWLSLANDNFRLERLAGCEAGLLRYDLSPHALFDTKLAMALPFDPATRGHFDDEIRALFPHTQVLRPGGLCWPGQGWLTIEALCANPSLRKRMYLKYGGADPAFNWGSRAVHRLDGAARRVSQLLARAAADASRGRHWVIQEAHRQRIDAVHHTREGGLREARGYLKASAFYGPSGLLGVMAYCQNAEKVHGTPDTVAGVVL